MEAKKRVRVAGLLLPLLFCSKPGGAQEMQPRAYVPAPVGLNFFGISYSNNMGGLLFDPSLPLKDVQASSHVSTLAFGQTVAALGRSAQLLVVLPYVVANLDGSFLGLQRHEYRSGLADTTLRFAINLHGAPALTRAEFARCRPKTIVGASVTVTPPTGQYDPAKVVNIGTNRWAVKPEIGASRSLGAWSIEGALGVWLYTQNDQFAGRSVRSQVPLGSVQAHVVRFLPHRMWISGDFTFFTGGRTRIDGADSGDYLGNSRYGVTFGISPAPRHAIKFTFFDGLHTRIGTDVRSIGVAYNIVWQQGR